MTDLLSDLTPAQREAVTHIDGPLLVLAAAGSGKTRVITRRVAYMLDQGIPGGKILAITFTNKAAGEMRERIRKLAPDSGVWVGTFHSVAARLLRAYATLVGIDRNFTIYDQGDRLRVIKETLKDLHLDESVSAERIDAVISRAKNDLVGPAELAKRGWDTESSIAAKVYKPYQDRLRKRSAMDFDDLMLHLVAILKQHPDVRAQLDARFRYVLVDEYQDTNLAQYAIVRALSVDQPNLCVTGDPDQSIYAWRGANLDNILEFEQDYPGCKVVKLERNYRSTKNILKVADSLIRRNKRRKPKALETENPEGSLIKLNILANEAAEAETVAQTISDLASRGGYAFRDMAVFCRVTALTRNLESALRKARVAYQIVGGVSFFERQEVKDVMGYLKLAFNPKDDTAFLRVVNAPPRGIGSTTVEALVEHAKRLELPLLAAARQAHGAASIRDRAAGALRDFGYLIDEIAAARELPAESALRSALSLTGFREHLADLPKTEAEERLANIDELVSAAREFDSSHSNPTIQGFVEEASLQSSTDRWKEDGGSVAVMTLHAAKGLEFPVVFIIGLEQGLLPHSRSSESGEELEEERRLLFVGMTRAQKELTLSYCKVREFRGSRQVTIPSCFLTELPEEMLEIEDSSQTSQNRFDRYPADRASAKGLTAKSAALGLPQRQSSAPRVEYDDGWDSSDSNSEGFLLRPGTKSSSAAGDRASSGSLEPRVVLTPDPADSGFGAPSVADLDAFRVGCSVLHPNYGIGRITRVDGAGPRRKAAITFSGGGERTFLIAKSPLRLVRSGSNSGPGSGPGSSSR